jgi:hypothetical protein
MVGIRLKRVRHDAPTWRDRRRAARRAAGWMSSYVVANGDDEWSISMADNVPCVVQDLSAAGVGLELASPDVRVDDQLVLDLQLGSDRRASIRLTGRVRHLTPSGHGCVRVGVEFLNVGNLERALLQRLLDDLKRRKSESAHADATHADAEHAEHAEADAS